MHACTSYTHTHVHTYTQCICAYNVHIHTCTHTHAHAHTHTVVSPPGLSDRTHILQPVINGPRWHQQSLIRPYPHAVTQPITWDLLFRTDEELLKWGFPEDVWYVSCSISPTPSHILFWLLAKCKKRWWDIVGSLFMWMKWMGTLVGRGGRVLTQQFVSNCPRHFEQQEVYIWCSLVTALAPALRQTLNYYTSIPQDPLLPLS